MSFKPWPFQLEALCSVINYFFENKTGNPIVCIPTGGGKGTLIAMLIDYILHYWPNQRLLQLVHTKELVQQNYNDLLKLNIIAPAGIYCAGLNKKDTANSIIFGSLGSVRNSVEVFGHRDLLIVDEAHSISPDEETGYRQIINKLTEINPNLRVVGFTATDYRLGQGKLTDGDNALFTDVCFDITKLHSFNRLIDEKYLAPLIVPSQLKTQLDVSNVGISKGEFNQTQLQKAVDKQEITYAAIQEAVQWGYDRNCWLVFASGVEHCEHVAEMLQSFGISATFVHSKITDDERDARIQAFKDGEVKAIVGFRILCLDEETEILTSDGFVGIDEMTYEHKLAAWKLDNSVEFTNPLFIIRRERFLDETMVNFNNTQGANIRTTSNHRTVYAHYSKTHYLECSAEEAFFKSHLLIPAYGFAEPFKIKAITPEHKQDRRKHINVTAFHMRKRGFGEQEAKEKAIEWVDKIRNKKYKNPEELSLDECFFIGFWLGDGTLSQGRCSISQSLRYNDTIEKLDNLFQRMNLSYSRQIYKNENPNIRWTFARGTGGYGQSVEQGYFELEPYLNKQGSKLFWGLNNAQFEKLLEGFFEADGNHHTISKSKNSFIITGTQIKLYELLQAIGSVRGFRITIGNKKKMKNEKHNSQWSMTCSNKKHWYFYNKLHGTLETEYKKERVWCVTSTTSYIICRRKGKVFVTGNTTGFNHPPIDMIIDLYPTVSPVMHVQKNGRGTRTYLGINPKFPYTKQNCLCLDFANNTRRIGPVNDPNIPKKKGDKTGEAPIKICEAKLPSGDKCGLYNHASARYCGGKPYPTPEGCGAEFVFKTKLVKNASNCEIIRYNELQEVIETFNVTKVIYHKHVAAKKLGAKPCMKVSYYSGIRKFTEYVHFEAIGMAKTRAARWWQQRSSKEVPATTDEALNFVRQLRCPKSINVRTDLQYAEIQSVEW